MKFQHIVAAASLACGALMANHASAVVVSSYSSAPGNLVTDFSTTGLAAFNLDLAQSSPATVIEFQVEAGDLGTPLAFNAVVANLFGLGIERFLLRLDNATFAFIGSVESGFGGSAPTASGSGDTAGLTFLPAETFGFNVGDPFGSGAQNWSIDISALNVGDTFELRLTVPEPGSLPLALAALMSLGWIAHRARRQD